MVCPFITLSSNYSCMPLHNFDYIVYPWKRASVFPWNLLFFKHYSFAIDMTNYLIVSCDDPGPQQVDIQTISYLKSWNCEERLKKMCMGDNSICLISIEKWNFKERYKKSKIIFRHSWLYLGSSWFVFLIHDTWKFDNF